MINIFNLKYEELEEFLVSINEKKYRTKQIYDWLYNHKIFKYHNMNNLSDELIAKLEGELSNDFIKIKEVQKGNKASKYLFELMDGNLIEAVLMKHEYGNSLCVSSQVGCNMGCSFCESGKLKKIRDLDAYEMVQQILLVEADIKMRLSSVIIMGIGEPFDNYDNVMKFIRIINSPHGLAIGARHITVSTCGLIPGIEKFSEENLQVNLAVSLHAARNDLREKLMPISKVYTLDKLIKALKKYHMRTNRRITIEYVILRNINDSREDAVKLAKLLKGMNVYVNLIPYNETSHLEFKKGTADALQIFCEVLKKAGIDITIRKEIGADIDAACGQLRAGRI